MTDSVLINACLVHMPPDQHDAWATWLTQHQLDPARIPVPSIIEIDNTNRTITAVYYQFNDDGTLQIDSHRNPVTVAAVRQLESPALPIPGGFPSGHDSHGWHSTK